MNPESAPFSYPQTATVSQVDNYHGVEVSDPFRWLEDTYSPQTKAWVAAQNELTQGFLATLSGRETLLKRLTALWNYPRFSLPISRGEQRFFSKNDGLQNQAVWLVEAADGSSQAREILDPNALSGDGTVAVAGFSVCDDGSRVAYGLSGAGSDWQTWRIRDVETGTDFPEELGWVKFSGASWTLDNQGFYYSRFPQPDESGQFQSANLHHKIYYHVVGTPQSDDILVFEQPDEPEWRMNAQVAEAGDWVAISIGKTGPKNRVYLIDLGDPQNPRVAGPIIKLIDEFEASFEFLGHDGNLFYFQTDWQAPRGQIIAIDLEKPQRDDWTTLVSEAEDTLRSALLSRDEFALTYLHNAFSEVRFFGLDGQFSRALELPGIGTVGGFSGRRRDAELFFSFTSFVTPTTLFRLDTKTGKSAVYRASGANFSGEGYETTQVWFESADGTPVPMFVTHRAGLVRDGSHPTYLTGYGGFNIALTPNFSPTLALWLEQGGVLAVPNLRGGGEFGEAWHEAGTKAHKQNVFDDFIAAAEFLIREKYTSPEKLAIAGGSNGGLLIGAVLNQRPELFAAAIPAVGVMDMLRFHQFTIGSAWIFDYGCSDDAAQFPALFAYSPLHNIKRDQKYPAVMVTTGDHDDRVVPGHSFKYAATLQAAHREFQGDAPILIRIETNAGHGAGKPMSKILEEQADVWTFLRHHLGLTEALES